MLAYSSAFIARVLSHWEGWLVRAVLLIFVFFQMNSIRHSSFIGQDYGVHVANTEQWVSQSGIWFAMDDTTRPLQYWIGGACKILTQGKYTYEAAAAFATLCAAVALGLLHDVSRRFIRDTRLRLAALIFVAFLPATLVTAVVYAADTFALLPFALSAWSLVRSIESANKCCAVGYALLTGVTLGIGCLTKLTFAILPLAVLGLLFAMAWSRLLSSREAIIICLCSVLTPLLVTVLAQFANDRYLGGVHPRHVIEMHPTGEMTWRSLLCLKRSDTRIFQAPTYWDTAIVKDRTVVPLIEHNGFSYLALLHLAVFTDVLDYLHRGGFDRTKPRPQVNQALARWSVRTGLAFSLVIVLGTLAFYGEATVVFMLRQTLPYPALVVWAAFSFAWYLPLFLVLPYVHAAYEWGYWLPRLTLPALWGFSLITFAMIDRWLDAKNERLVQGVVLITLLQTALQVRSVWY